MTKLTLNALAERITLLEAKNLTNSYKIEIQELEEGFAPIAAHNTDAGHDLKIRPIETSGLVYSKLRMYLNPSAVGKSFSELPPLYINGQYINWFNIGNSNRFDYVSNLIESYKTKPAICLAEHTDKDHCKTKVGVGFKIKLPELFKIAGWTVTMLIASRSGLSYKGIRVLNSPGVIDASYTGEIKIALENIGFGVHIFDKGAKLGQALILPCISLNKENTILVNSLAETTRGSSGFGSTGVIFQTLNE